MDSNSSMLNVVWVCFGCCLEVCIQFGLMYSKLVTGPGLFEKYRKLYSYKSSLVYPYSIHYMGVPLQAPTGLSGQTH